MIAPRSLLTLTALFCVLGFCTPALAEGAGILAATPQQKKTATDSYMAGMLKFQKKNFGLAMADFEDSYGAVKSPNALLMVARSLIELGQLSEGYRRLLQTEVEAAEAKKTSTKYEATEVAARESRLELGRKLGLLTLKLQGTLPGDKVLLEGRELEAEDWKEPVPVMPGVVEAVFQRGERQQKQSVEVQAGSSATLEIDATEPKAAPPPEPKLKLTLEAKVPEASASKTLFYVSGGVGVAGVATFAFFGASSRSKYNELERACPGEKLCPASLASTRDEGKRAQAIANIGLVLGIFGASSAAFFYLSADPAPASTAPVARVTNVGVGLNSVVLNGSF